MIFKSHVEYVIRKIKTDSRDFHYDRLGRTKFKQTEGGKTPAAYHFLGICDRWSSRWRNILRYTTGVVRRLNWDLVSCFIRKTKDSSSLHIE